MYAIRFSNESRSQSKSSNHFDCLPRQQQETNVEWWERARAQIAASDGAAILLIGGRDVAHFRLRAAQSVARNDLSPSHWSHAALVTHVDKAWSRRTAVHEIALAPKAGFGWPPERNAMNRGTLADYADALMFPNVALIAVPCASSEVQRQLKAFERKPLEVDGVRLLVDWLGYLWGARDERNPLERSVGMPSAVMIEAVIGAAWRDLTPGLATLASCPEAIWQAAKHWSQYHALTTPPAGAAATNPDQPRSLRGHYCTDNRLVPEDDSNHVVYSGR